MKKTALFLSVALTLLLSSCEMFKVDIVAYLEKYTNTAAIEVMNLDDSYPSVNGITHISSDSDKIVRFVLRNPQNYELDLSIDWENLDTAPSSPSDYTLVQSSVDRSLIELTLTKEFLQRLDNAGGADVSATINIVENESKREFDSFSYDLIVNSEPPMPEYVAAVKNDNVSNNWYLAFNLANSDGRKGIHKDIKGIKINGTLHEVSINDAGIISFDDDDFSTNQPEHSGNAALLESPTGLVFIHSSGDSVYFKSSFNAVSNATYNLSFVDERGLSSPSVTVSTAGVVRSHYYVEQVDNDSNDTGSAGNPFESVQLAIDEIVKVNDSKTHYTVHVKGASASGLDSSSMTIVDSSKRLNVTVQGKSSSESGRIGQSNKRAFYVNNSNVNLTLGDNFTIEGGSADYGAGILIELGTVNLTGAIITGNSASAANSGGGVYVGERGVLNLSGSPRVKDNTNGNIAMHENAKVYIIGELTGDNVSIGITPPKGDIGGVYASGNGYNITSDDVDKIESDVSLGDEAGIELGIYNNNVILSSLLYYVASSKFGGNNNNSGVTSTKPFLTVQEAIDRIVNSGRYEHDYTIKIKGEVQGGHLLLNRSIAINYIGSDRLKITLEGFGGGDDSGTIRARDSAHVIHMVGNIEVTLGENLTLTGGSSVHHGAAVYMRLEDGSDEAPILNLDGAVITGNHAKLSAYTSDPSFIAGGGAVYVKEGTFNMNSGEISGNSAYNGGGVLVLNGTFNMKGGTISGNNATSIGGGVHMYAGTSFAMHAGTVSGNTANIAGGVFLESPLSESLSDRTTGIMTGGTIENNRADDRGGGLFVDDGAHFTIDKINPASSNPDVPTIIRNNTANFGGGIYVDNSKSNADHGQSILIMNDGSVSGNTATSHGGGIYIWGNLSMIDGTILNNTANGNGGGVLVYGNAEFSMTGGTISYNTAKHAADGGGGVYVDSQSSDIATFTMTGGTITKNGIKLNADGSEVDEPAHNGGGVYLNNNALFTMNGETAQILGNKANDVGGGIFINDGGQLIIHNGKVNDNFARQGGGVFVDGQGTHYGGSAAPGEFTFNGGSINGNEADETSVYGYGGGVYVYPNAVFTLGEKTSATREINGNNANIAGGIFIERNEVTLKDIDITGNHSASGASAIHIDNDSTLTILDNTDISGNTSDDNEAGSTTFFGGTIYIDPGATLNIQGGSITGNESDYGAIKFRGIDDSDVQSQVATLNLQGNVTILDNTSRDGSVEKNIVFDNSNRIKITGSLSTSGDDSIGLSPTYDLSDQSGVVARKGDSYAGLQSGDASAFFFDDGRSASISVQGNTLAAVELSAKPTITSVSWDGVNGIRKVKITGSGTIYYTIGNADFDPDNTDDWKKITSGDAFNLTLNGDITLRAIAVESGKAPSNEAVQSYARAEKLTEPTINFELDEESETVTMKIESVAGATITARVSKTINGVSSVDIIDSVVGDNGFFTKTYDVEADGDTIEVEFAKAAKDGMLTSDEAAAQRYTIAKLFLNIAVMQGGKEIADNAIITFDKINFSYALPGGESVGEVTFTVRVENGSGSGFLHRGVELEEDIDISSFAGDSEITVSVKAMEKGFLGTDELVVTFRKFAIGDVGPAGGIIFSYDENTGIYKEVGEVISESPITYGDAGVRVASKSLAEGTNWGLPDQESLEAINGNLINNPAFSSKVNYLKDLTFITSTKNGDNRILVTLKNGSATISEGSADTVTGAVMVIHMWKSSS